MWTLDRKLLRDLWHLKGQATAIILVISAGVGTFIMSTGAYFSLEQGKQAFYRDYRFADVFANARHCPNSLLPRIEKIPGVITAEPRLVREILLDLPTLNEPAKGKLISIPRSGESELNRIYISRGRMLEPNRSDEAVVSEMFADAHGIEAGALISAIINGKRQNLRIVGVARTPEFIIQIQEGTVLPDKKRFGIFWMNQRALESSLDMAGAFNSLSLKTSYNSNPQRIIKQLDQLLKPYGAVGAYDRSQQLSHQFITDELVQLRTMAILAPAIFFSVAAFLLNIVVSRIVSQQREQIGALKAFGYSNWTVGFHFLNMVLMISLTGVVVGTLFGIWMGSHLTDMYQEFYKFPALTFHISLAAILWALLLTTLSAVGGTWLAVRKAVVLPPSEAMRPEPPPNFSLTKWERFMPSQLFPHSFRMIARNLSRRPIKTGVSILGIAMAIAVLILGSFFLDALDYLIEFQYQKAQRQDVTIGFDEPVNDAVVHELESLDGVLGTELLRTVPTRIRFQHASKRVGLMGLVQSPQLFRLLDSNENSIEMPAHGIVLNSKLAEVLGARLGDDVTVEVLDGKRVVFQVEIASIVSEFFGINAYMAKDQLHRQLKESGVSSGGFLTVDPVRQTDVYSELVDRPKVSSVTVKAAAIESFVEIIAENMLTMRSFNILFAVFIAVGVVYNSARISLSEQSRNLATMRVIGFSKREVAAILLGELAVLTMLAIPIGCLMGYVLAAGLIAGLETENYRFPLIVNRSTFAFAALVVVIAALGSGLIVQRRINRLDLVAVLKTRD